MPRVQWDWKAKQPNNKAVSDTPKTNERSRGIHSCHDACARPMCVLRRERDEARKDVLDLMEEYENRFA